MLLNLNISSWESGLKHDIGARECIVPYFRMPHKSVRHYDVHWHQGQKNGRASMVYALTLDELLASFEQRITRPLHFNN